MTSTVIWKFALGLAIGGLGVLGLATMASSHTDTQTGGDGDNVLVGHGHTDYLYGRGGCDGLQGEGDADQTYGGTAGCDVARGNNGNSDASVVCDDNASFDYALGGDGIADGCYASAYDLWDDTCEYKLAQPFDCI